MNERRLLSSSPPVYLLISTMNHSSGSNVSGEDNAPKTSDHLLKILPKSDFLFSSHFTSSLSYFTSLLLPPSSPPWRGSFRDQWLMGSVTKLYVRPPFPPVDTDVGCETRAARTICVVANVNTFIQIKLLFNLPGQRRTNFYST